MKRVGELTKLHILGIDATKVTDVGLENIQRMTSLTSLDLLHTRVTDAGLENLDKLTSPQQTLARWHGDHRCWNGAFEKAGRN